MKERETLPIAIDRIITVGVDIQHDFINGTLAVAEGVDIIEPMNALTSFTRQLGGVAAFTRDWHPETTAHFEKWPVHCVAETLGAEFHPALHIEPTDRIISKGTSTRDDGYSGFEGMSEDGQSLESLIRPQSQRERVGVVIGGLATDYCDLATVIDALHIFQNQPNVYIAAATDAMRAVNLEETDGQKALDTMEAHGAYLVSSNDILEGRIFSIEREV